MAPPSIDATPTPALPHRGGGSLIGEASPRPPLHQGRPLGHADQLLLLVVHPVLEGHDPRLGPRARILEPHHLGLGAKRVADEHRPGHPHLVVAEVGDQRSERGVADRKADQEREGEGAVDDDPPELGSFRIGLVEVERLRIVGQRRDQQIVGLGDRPVRLVPYPVAQSPLLVIAPGHRLIPPRNGEGDHAKHGGGAERDGGASAPPPRAPRAVPLPVPGRIFEPAPHHPSPFSIRASIAPSLTCAPSSAFSSATIPSNGAARLCSIFIASSVTSFWPLVTASPCFTASAMILPGIGETMLPSPTLAPPPPPWRGAAKRQVAP